MDIYLGSRLPDSSSDLPGDDWETGSSRPKGLLSCLILHRMGVACPTALLQPPVVSYTAISPLLTCKGERYPFCGPIQTLTRFRALPGMLPYGVRTFLGHKFARGHPANLDSNYTVNVLEKCRNWYWVLGE